MRDGFNILRHYFISTDKSLIYHYLSISKNVYEVLKNVFEGKAVRFVILFVTFDLKFI